MLSWGYKQVGGNPRLETQCGWLRAGGRRRERDECGVLIRAGSPRVCMTFGIGGGHTGVTGALASGCELSALR